MCGYWRQIFHRALGAGLCAALGVSGAQADDNSSVFNVSATVGSDYLFRGFSLTLGGPTVQATVAAEFESGFYAYVFGANVDLVPDSEPDDGARVEVDLALGYAKELTEHLSFDATLVRYIYPGTVDGMNYNYNELITTFCYDERYCGMLGYSNNVFGLNADGLFANVSARYELPAGFSMGLEYGHYNLEDAYGASYSYANVGIGRQIGALDFTLAYNDTFGGAQQVFYAESIGSRVVLTVGFDF